MIALKLVLEGLGLGFLLYLICAIGIRNGAVGMVHLYDQKVQERVVQLGLSTADEIRKRSMLFRSMCLPGYLIYVLICVYVINGAIGSSLGSTFVGQLIQREKVHLDHGIFGSPDLDQSGKFSAWLQSKLVVPLLTSFTKSEKKKAKTREKLKNFFEMDDETADRFMGCFARFSPESIKNEYYTDLLTWLKDDIHVEGTKVHFIYANKMGEKYLNRYKKYFRDPEIREFDMQHEQWLFGGEQYTAPVLQAIDEFMDPRS